MAAGQINSVLPHLRRVTLRADGGGMTDGQLLDCFVRNRDEAAFAGLVRRHGPMVLGVCRRLLRHAQDAEDAFQAAFLVLARKAGSLAQRELVGNWLYGVAYRAALEVKATRRRREKQVSAMPEPGVVDAADADHELLRILDQELNRLPDKYRVAIVLCDLEGRTRREVARLLGIPIGTLSGRLTTARRTLAQRLARRGLAVSSSVLAVVLSQGSASASVPPALVLTTTRAATGIAAGKAAATVVSTRVAAATEGVLKSMLLRKLKTGVGMLLACAAVGTAVLMGLQTLAAERVPGQSTTVADAPAAKTPAANAPAPRAAVPAAQQGELVQIKTDTIHALAFAPDSLLLAAGGEDSKVRVWDMSNNKVKWTLEGPKGIVRKVVFSKDGKTLAVGADDGGVYLFDVVTGKLDTQLHADLPRKLPKEPKKWFDGIAFINGLVFLPKGKLAAVYDFEPLKGGGRESQIRIWDIAAKKDETLYQHKGEIYSLTLSPDGNLLAATVQGGDFEGFKVWDLDTNKVAWEEKSGTDFMSSVLFSPDGKKLAVGGGHSIQVNQGFKSEARLWLFDVMTKKQLWHVKEPENWGYSQIAFTIDSKGLLTGSSGAIRPYLINGVTGEKVVSELRRWEVATGKVAWKSEGEMGHFGAVAASADGKTLAGSDSEQLMLFEPDTGALREVLAKTKYGKILDQK